VSATFAARISRRTLLAGLALAPAIARARSEDQEVIAYLGIRYGRAERFQAPRPAPQSAPLGVYGPSSPQRGAPGSEDCLFLNIWRPRRDPDRPRPVMVYFHGGAYSTGGANSRSSTAAGSLRAATSSW
jgi:para-nitrobenzyl esterase